MSTAITTGSTNPYYLNGTDATSTSCNDGNQVIEALIQIIEALLQQMVAQGSDSSSSGDVGAGGQSGSGAPSPFSLPPALSAPPAAGVPTSGGVPASDSTASTPSPTGTPSTVTSPTSTSPTPPGVSGGSPGAQVGTSVSQPPNSINVADFGAIGDGKTDDTQALQNAFNTAAAEGKTAYIPPGTYNHSGTLSLNGVNVVGAGSQTVLAATNPDKEAITLGSNSSLSNIETTVSAPNRSSQPEAAAIDVTGSNDRVSHVTTLGAASNGIRLDGATGAQISSNLVEGSNADGIALMNGSSNNTVDGNEVYQAGDDSYSDDSYTFDSKQDSGNVFSNDLALDNSYGRSFALMGSTGDTIKNSVSDRSQWMGIVAGTDSSSQTMNGSNDTIENNLILNPNGDAVDVMSPGGVLSQSGAGMNVSGNSTNGSLASVLGFTPAASLVDRSQINNSYRAGTGDGAHNGS